MHEYQISILKELLLTNGARFRDLKKNDIENHHFNFHLKSLIDEGLVEKKQNLYFLTIKGKREAGLIDTDNLNFEKQAKLSVALHPMREINGGVEFLFHKRLKQPFFGYMGSQSGKIKYGETPLQAAERELLEETGLKGKSRLVEIIHITNYDTNTKELLEDKYFWVFIITDLKGELLEKVDGGENIWMSLKDFGKLKNVFGSAQKIEMLINQKNVIYSDRDVVIDNW